MNTVSRTKSLGVGGGKLDFSWTQALSGDCIAPLSSSMEEEAMCLWIPQVELQSIISLLAGGDAPPLYLLAS